MVKFFFKSCVFITAVFSSACVHIKKHALNSYISRFQDKKAEDKKVYFKPLPPSYKKQNHSVLDAFWRNAVSKTSISYFSSCSNTQKNLKSFQTSVYPKKYKKIQFYKIKNGLYSVLEISQSQNDNIYTAIYTIQKKQCYFNINLVAGSFSSFKKEEPLFKKFIESFNYK